MEFYKWTVKLGYSEDKFGLEQAQKIYSVIISDRSDSMTYCSVGRYLNRNHELLRMKFSDMNVCLLENMEAACEDIIRNGKKTLESENVILNYVTVQVDAEKISGILLNQMRFKCATVLSGWIGNPKYVSYDVYLLPINRDRSYICNFCCILDLFAKQNGEK
ncbi:hypothetical protein D918_05222 [Trichuris suis]|nr:hypothetical protein D918_05222 [Trichuris suis]